jgi:hypothetical protein
MVNQLDGYGGPRADEGVKRWKRRWPAARRPLLLLLLGWLVWLPPAPSLSAQTSTPGQRQPIVGLSQATYEFGQVMRFSLIARGEAAIDSVTLFVRAPELPYTLTAELEIESGRQVVVEHHLDLTQVRLPPFVPVTFWWRVTDVTGNSVMLPEQIIEYGDDQFVWQQMAGETVSGPIRVYWSGDGVATGQAALDVAAEVMPRLAAVVPITWQEPLHIYIYPSAADLRAALRLTGRDWVGAHAHPELGVILVTASNPRTAVVDLRQSIPHELSHLLLYQATGPGYASVPRWFDEGLASLFEVAPNPAFEAILQEAIATGATIPFAELCYHFPAGDDRVTLAYAQSVSLVRLIQAEYGNNALNQMVRAFVDGADCQSAVKRVLGMSLAELNAYWLRSQQLQSPAGQFLRQNVLWIAIVAAGFAVMSLLLLRPPVTAGAGAERRVVDGGRRTMDGGRWTMDGGRRTMDDGRRTMNDGRRTMDDGRRTMDDGR